MRSLFDCFLRQSIASQRRSTRGFQETSPSCARFFMEEPQENERPRPKKRQTVVPTAPAEEDSEEEEPKDARSVQRGEEVTVVQVEPEAPPTETLQHPEDQKAGKEHGCEAAVRCGRIRKTPRGRDLLEQTLRPSKTFEISSGGPLFFTCRSL